MATIDVPAVFNDVYAMAEKLTADMTAAIQTASDALSQTGIYEYKPYEFQPPIMTFGGPDRIIPPPGKPGAPNLRPLPIVQEIKGDLPKEIREWTELAPVAKDIDIPPTPTSPSIGAQPSPPPQPKDLNLPQAPTLMPLGDTTLPYPTIRVPTAPLWLAPIFIGKPPDPIQTITLDEYLQKLTDTYAEYSSSMPDLVQSNWRKWYATVLADHPMIGTLQGILTSYFNTGGAGIPVTIENAIITRAQDKVTGEQRRATSKVWDEMAKRGLWMPSGALVAGLKEAAQISAEATSKVVTDTAIKNLELEHDHMKFMLGLAEKLEETLQTTSVALARGVIEINGQAIELTKTVLQGMIAINDAIVRIYLAQWEGYKAAVEKYRSDIQVITAKIQLYEAEIRAELAKTEVNKAKVSVIQTIAQANLAIVQAYKAQIDGETARLEADRVRAIVFEAQMRGFTGTVEAYRARWEGYGKEVDARLAQSRLYESKVHGYSAKVGAYAEEVRAYSERVRAVGVKAEAISKSNVANLASWTAEADGLLKAFGENMRAFATEWQAKVEEARVNAQYYQANVGAITAYNNITTQQQMEMGRQHLAQWTGQLEAALRAAAGLGQLAGITQNAASASLSGLTAFAGQFSSQ